ncbi:MAG: hypothetical protein HY888_09260 [Deltaproteobacteria bacterium]|nr:hypothetical protein [Deltaproteobacteria bacterium]
MTDLQLWDKGLRSIEKLLADIPESTREQFAELLAAYRLEKEALAAIVRQVDAETICRECAGKCCLNGKYRINILDLLALCAANTQLSPDFGQKPLCPYGTTHGCSLEPGFRPADCILFLCDALDGQLSIAAGSTLAVSEKSLRDLMRKATQLLGVPVAVPLLLWAEKI